MKKGGEIGEDFKQMYTHDLFLSEKYITYDSLLNWSELLSYVSPNTQSF